MEDPAEKYLEELHGDSKNRTAHRVMTYRATVVYTIIGRIAGKVENKTPPEDISAAGLVGIQRS